ncbi:MAG TPA: hypothetical protein PKC98_19940 [Candidatus Melainabacteria bacterium]|nr:hypothetical protein [Candidatus Melainabacteria bacterium]
MNSRNNSNDTKPIDSKGITMEIFNYTVMSFPFTLFGFILMTLTWIVLSAISPQIPKPQRTNLRSGLFWALMTGVVCSQLLYLMYKFGALQPISFWHFTIIGVLSSIASIAGACYSNDFDD